MRLSPEGLRNQTGVHVARRRCSSYPSCHSTQAAAENGRAPSQGSRRNVDDQSAAAAFFVAAQHTDRRNLPRIRGSSAALLQAVYFDQGYAGAAALPAHDRGIVAGTQDLDER